MTLRDKVESLVKQLRDQGLKGVRFLEAKVSDRQQCTDDMISDGYSKELAEEWADNYVNVNLCADIPNDDCDHEYGGFRYEDFEYDLRRLFVTEIGEDNLEKDKHFTVDIYGGDTEIYNREEYEKKWSPRFRRER